MIVGLALGVVALTATASFAGKSAFNGFPAQGGIAGQKNIGGNGIVGSSHDLSNVGNLKGSQDAADYVTTADRQNRICVYCHHPHNAHSASDDNGYTGGRDGLLSSALTYSPLWNRDLSTQTFVGYDNGAFMGAASIDNPTDKRHALNAADDSDSQGTGINGVSLLCMSCHDGVVAMNAYSTNTGTSDGGGAATGTSSAITSSAGFKGDMNNHHPMGFSYTEVQAVDAEIAAETVPITIDGLVKIGDVLVNNEFECVSCHDVHNTANSAGAERFLWRSNNESNFCLVCHLK